MKRKLDEAELVIGLYQEAQKTSSAEGQTRRAELQMIENDWHIGA